MARRLVITWGSGDKVTARLVVPPDEPNTGLLLAHGAGAGQDHPWMTSMRDLLAAGGLTVMTFNYAYTEAGRRSPDRMARLLEVHHAAADRLAGYVDRVVLAGKSMGGRVSSHLAGDDGWPAHALVYFGYPLVPVGKGEPRPTDHLDRITAPQLFVAGTRDRLSPPDLIEPLADAQAAGHYHEVDDGDHSLRVPKRAGVSNEEVLARVAGYTVGWIAGL